MLIKTILNKAGFDVEIAQNGQEALKMIHNSHFDLVLMDMQMPVMGGLEATAAIRSVGFTDVPIIALTANALPGDQQRCLDSGMNDYITKPINRKEVIQKIKQWIQASETKKELYPGQVDAVSGTVRKEL